jgi:putative transposase
MAPAARSYPSRDAEGGNSRNQAQRILAHRRDRHPVARRTRLYLHAVIDNFSRRILAWKLAARLEPQSTCAILSTAGAGLDLSRNPATVVADSGVENVNGDVDALLGLGRLRRVLAQVEVTFSNAMIEAWWRSLKHNWLFLNHLDTHAAVEGLVAFYVQQHNA